ncbi:sulfotransferase family protein [Roseateles amylovorans]|uniref:Sulfotransferase n=1 Tax=Roseateles amylovorans TaxID=2978473 RepID=A0ABY6AWZ9_9BURK|nr:sulfotransferase [Roseateles amylovorans]UXH76929.1 sulfotransferase [Roseateles amylovorans]
MALTPHDGVSNRLPSAMPLPLLMTPLRRCGSHALRLRLNLNPHFYSPYPLHIVDFMPLVPLYGDLTDDRRYFRMVVDVVGLQAAGVVKWADMAFDPVEIFDALKDQPRSVHRIAWELLLRAGQRHGATVVMDKSLDSIHYAEEQLALFPQMRFLNVVRDPRAQVASMNRAIIHDFDTTLNALSWLNAHQAGRALAQAHPDRVLTIRFEDFITNQEQVLRRVCSFIDIEFLPEMLDVAASSEARQLSKLSDLWQSNCYAPLPAMTDKFKAQLSMEEIETIESLTQALMAFYGYECMTPASKPAPDAQTLARCAETSERGRRQAWAKLSETNPRDYVLRRFRADYLSHTRQSLEAGLL